MKGGGKPGLPLVLGGLLIALVAADLARRAIVGRPRQEHRAPGASAEEPGETVRASSAVVAESDAARRRQALDRIAAQGQGTYLTAILGADSLLKRWPDQRLVRPLSLAVVRGSDVRGFREDFVANVAWAVSRWNGALLPVQMRLVADSAGADVVVTWTDRFEGTRAGRADLTWDNLGRIVRARVVLATHDPRGEAFDGPEMVALALHELGHALGLDHSPVREDALHAETRATELTERDLRTARLLYSLPPGSLKGP